MVQASDLYKKNGSHTAPTPQAKQSLQRLAKFLPIALIVAFVLLLALLFGERFVPARPVQLESVVTQRSQQVAPAASTTQPSSTDVYGGTVVFQASGWIEADPLPIRVAALNDGFVDTVHVLEGEPVHKG